MTVVKYTCDPLEKCNVYHKARPSSPGCSSISLKLLSEYTFVDLELYGPTVYKLMGGALQPYKELTWEHAYMWKKQKAVMHYMSRPNNDRHHVLIGQCLQ